MGRFAYSMNVSLDLRIEQVPGDNGAGEWLRISEELHREFNARTRAVAMMVQGRVFYETMEEYWPRARGDASLPDVLCEFGEIWTAKPKVLVSRTRRSADHNTRSWVDTMRSSSSPPSVPRPTAPSVWAARRSPRSCSAPSCSRSCCSGPHPAILGFGRPLFDEYDVPIELDLLQQRSFEQGVTMHRYAVHDVSEASSC
jgi:hypothetical protein